MLRCYFFVPEFIIMTLYTVIQGQEKLCDKALVKLGLSKNPRNCRKFIVANYWESYKIHSRPKNLSYFFIRNKIRIHKLSVLEGKILTGYWLVSISFFPEIGLLLPSEDHFLLNNLNLKTENRGLNKIGLSLSLARQHLV